MIVLIIYKLGTTVQEVFVCFSLYYFQAHEICCFMLESEEDLVSCYILFVLSRRAQYSLFEDLRQTN